MTSCEPRRPFLEEFLRIQSDPTKGYFESAREIERLCPALTAAPQRYATPEQEVQAWWDWFDLFLLSITRNPAPNGAGKEREEAHG
ncbi:MAG: hypothetical protein UY48_C0002G0025 [Candidatus Gottesmanbacteria bacterium GW2011_GWB1_49_7]|uniref:Uncharacterized protein n=1 Tax=Candidatus Gottesmanbacteria bacterium GW2011_GWB1_49_7 TaxID=1618448 RepID=A0A0G1Z3G7_9BACT|nr:MAG: hypothetical protein UY48_C0002G0025 [Candidatus Gottesmanbacteria bacterium GW2011_GWB1_49_7]